MPVTPATAALPHHHSHTGVAVGGSGVGLIQTPSEHSFWTFQGVLIRLLVLSTALMVHRKRVVQSAHERRIERLANA